MSLATHSFDEVRDDFRDQALRALVAGTAPRTLGDLRDAWRLAGKVADQRTRAGLGDDRAWQEYTNARARQRRTDLTHLDGRNSRRFERLADDAIRAVNTAGLTLTVDLPTPTSAT